jgi:4-hydroxybenzoate polyprenyltransferase
VRLALALLASLRPRQWVKNLFVFAGVIFSQQLLTPRIWPALAAFAIFCGLSGSVYLFNDVADADKDRLHPAKRLRPIASGALPVGAALGFGVLLLAGSLAAAFMLSPAFGLVALCYGALLTAYSVWLKHVVIVDVLTVSAGFVLRAVAGAVAVDVEISGWLTGDAAAHRPILADYSEGFLDQMISVVTASTVTTYALYTMSPETVAKFHTRLLPLTLPFVLYGVFRYLYLLYRRDLGGNPSDLVVTDRGLLLDVLLWTLTTLAIIYGPKWAD